MPARTPEERALVARIANASRLAKYSDHSVLTERARSARRAQFEAQALAANPSLTGPGLAEAADHLMHAHMLRMSLKAKQSRRRAKQATAAADAAEAELRDLGAGDAA